MQIVQKTLFILAALAWAVVDLAYGVEFLIGSFQGERSSVAGFTGFLMVAAVPGLVMLRSHQFKSRVVRCQSCGWTGTLRRWESGVEWTETVRRRGALIDRTVGSVERKRSAGCPQCHSDVYMVEGKSDRPFAARKSFLVLAGVTGGTVLLILSVLGFDTPPGEPSSPQPTPTRIPSPTPRPPTVTPVSKQTVVAPTPSPPSGTTPVLTPDTEVISPTPPAFGLIAWWPGEGHTRDLVGDHSGTGEEGVGFQEGLFGLAFLFDGTSGYIEVPHDPDLNLSGSSFTIDAWIEPTHSGEGKFRWIVDKSFGNTNLDFSFGLHSDGRLRFITRNLDNDLLSPTVVPLNTFTHVAAVQDAVTGSIRLYMNGDEVARAILTGDPVTNEAPLVLGGRLYDAIRHPFSGLIDEIHIYRRSLSSSEIQALFDAQSASKSP